MVDTDGVFRTQDMVLATVLICAGFKPKLERLNSRWVCWIFDSDEDREEEFDDLVDAYENQGARVEPKSYTIELNRVRSAMFDFLGETGNRRPRSAPSASPASG